ncbi:MAG: ABC transporter permease subunit [Acidibacillus sp.]|nr:ABC transporter permease subunit [Acidibacillus sp.]
MIFPKLPLAHWVNLTVNWTYQRLGPMFQVISHIVHTCVRGLIALFIFVPWWMLIILFAILTFKAGRWRLMIGSVLGLLLIYDLQLWSHMISTLVLVLVSSLLSVSVGLPLGIVMARHKRMDQLLSPLLDLMQTMPSFVYLVPVLMFFNIGIVPAIFATLIFAMPPVIRLTRLGILQVPSDVVEAARAYGANDGQLLWKVQIPLALLTIKAGINQTIMLSLSMVVISAMIGAGGLGENVVSALSTINVGKGFDAGISIVIIAIILDRLSQRLGRSQQPQIEQHGGMEL